jgi:hypothetical protein
MATDRSMASRRVTVVSLLRNGSRTYERANSPAANAVHVVPLLGMARSRLKKETEETKYTVASFP